MRLLPRTRLGVLWRAALAGLLVIGFAAGATAVAGLLQVKTILTDIDQNRAISGVDVSLPAYGQPQTILLIGADHRPGQGAGIGNTDTMLLVRINDSSKTINLLSVPRDLEVNIPGVGVSKLNSAYADGGANLLLRTLKQQVFPGLVVNHIVIFGFTGFAKLVNEIGCVYTAVDQRYYNDNNGTVENDYSNINLEPGYQKLCGGSGANLGGADTALAFVRFRHTDSDEIRNAAQQDFMRWAKDQYSLSQLIGNEKTLLHTFFKYSEVDSHLRSTDAILNLVHLVLNADGLELKTIQFPEEFGPCVSGQQTPCYVLPTSQAAEQQTYAEFMQPSSSVPPVGQIRLGNGTAGAGRGRGKGSVRGFQLPAGMEDEVGDGRSQAEQVGDAGLPVYYPKFIPDTYAYCFTISGNCAEQDNPASVYANSYPRRYAIDGPGGRAYPAYVLTLVAASGDETETGTGHFLSVQGTTWQDPPLLREPSLIRTVNGRQLYVYSQGGHISTVAWHTRRAVYWIQNNLQNLLPNPQMVAMAATLTPAST